MTKIRVRIGTQLMPAPIMFLLAGIAALSMADIAAAQPFDLTVSKDGAGRGTVTRSPAGIECQPAADSCASFAAGTIVTLTAMEFTAKEPKAQDEGSSRFAGWRECSPAGGCTLTPEKTKTVTMDAARSVVATFDATIMNVSAGLWHTCARLSDGAVQCWGSNNAGQLGNGTTTDSSWPVIVSGITTAVAVSAGASHTCAALRDGTVRCWGDNTYGQLGVAPGAAISTTPVQPGGLSGSAVTSIAAGHGFTCASLLNRTVRCWGNNMYSQLGVDRAITASSSTPVQIASKMSAEAVTAGMFHACARLTDGSLRCWGANNVGQLGSGAANPSVSFTPVSVAGHSAAADVEAGQNHTCARLVDSTVRCWGNNFHGELGDGATPIGWEAGSTQSATSATPVTVNVPKGASVSSGGSHSCAMLADRTVRCWGNNTYGQLGSFTVPIPVGYGRTAPYARTPVKVDGIATATEVTAGGGHTCVRLTDGTAQCWGLNNFGQLGNGTTTDSPAAVAVGPLNFALTIVKAGTGRGTVSGTPGGPDCSLTSATCSVPVLRGHSVLLTATPAVRGSSFAGWSACTGTDNCLVVMNAATSVTATFSRSAVADYRFQDVLTSSVAGAPALVNLGTNTFEPAAVEANLARTVLTFPQHNGVSLSGTTGVIPSHTYSIVLLMRLVNIQGNNRLIDFKNGTADSGLYVQNGSLVFHDRVSGNGAPPIAASRFAQVVLTRDAAGLVSGYVDAGPSSQPRSVPLQFAFWDVALGPAVISSSNTLRFFKDDTVEDFGASVARIRLYDGPLTAAEISALDW